MKVKFLLDENLSPRLKLAVVRLEPEIDIIRIGDYSAPALGTLDRSIEGSTKDWREPHPERKPLVLENQSNREQRSLRLG